jgi:hypothetical protein
VFVLAPPAVTGAGWIEEVLYKFKGGANDGMLPTSRLLIGKNGTLYGNTLSGVQVPPVDGGGDWGTIFALSPPAASGGVWTESLLYSLATQFFAGDPLYVFNPYDGLIFGHDGGLIRTASLGGISPGVGGFELFP